MNERYKTNAAYVVTLYQRIFGATAGDQKQAWIGLGVIVTMWPLMLAATILEKMALRPR